MSYVLGQYNKNKNVADDNIFMTLITSGTPRRRQGGGDTGVESVSDIFEDECIQIDNLNTNKNYYFHGKIKRMTSTQTFYIKLVNYSPSTVEEEDNEQYLKTVTISKGDPDEWVDVEFIFTPLVNFDCILFELKRTVDDYRTETRYPLIAYEELSEINNIISSRITDGAKLIKVGVQSRPGLLMCINGEEIRTSRTGIYELKNGVITVSFFSVCSAIKEGDSTMTDWINSVDEQINEIIRAQEAGEITTEEAESRKAAINSNCFFGSNKQTRSIDSFTLDYMYLE